MKIEIQKDVNGCGIACLATVVGVSYDQLAAEWRKQHGDFEKGLYPDEVHRFLWAIGCFVLRKYRRIPEHCADWPPKPFAEIHIVEVIVKGSRRTHYVLMDEHGTLFDPVDGGARTWDDFEDVNRVEGIIKP